MTDKLCARRAPAPRPPAPPAPGAPAPRHRLWSDVVSGTYYVVYCLRVRFAPSPECDTLQGETRGADLTYGIGSDQTSCQNRASQTSKSAPQCRVAAHGQVPHFLKDYYLSPQDTCVPLLPLLPLCAMRRAAVRCLSDRLGGLDAGGGARWRACGGRRTLHTGGQ